jgi:hypothetical protein
MIYNSIIRYLSIIEGNNINERGLEYLYEAVKYQSDFFVDANRNVGAGLMRLSLQVSD